MIRVILALLLLASSVSAGPWPREEGEGFLSFSVDLDAEEFENNFASLYLEYGLKRDRTLVLDVQGQEDDMSKAFAALRFPIGSSERQLKLSYEVGLGTVGKQVSLRTGFSAGRGWNSGQRSGWWSLDTRALLFDDAASGKLEGDFTFGVQLTPRIKTIAQLQTGAPSESDFYAKIAQSVVLETSAAMHYFAGVTAGVHEADDLQLNIGLWHNF